MFICHVNMLADVSCIHDESSAAGWRNQPSWLSIVIKSIKPSFAIARLVGHCNPHRQWWLAMALWRRVQRRRRLLSSRAFYCNIMGLVVMMALLVFLGPKNTTCRGRRDTPGNWDRILNCMLALMRVALPPHHENASSIASNRKLLIFSILGNARFSAVPSSCLPVIATFPQHKRGKEQKKASWPEVAG